MAILPRSRHADQRSLRHAAETLADPLPALMVEAERVANTVAFGIHGRRRVGQGETFWQFRHYTQGDPRNTIDWRKSARAPSRETLYVRDHEWEAAQSVYFAIDRSPSMVWRSAETLRSKEESATVLGLALSLLLVRAGERIGHLISPLRPSTGRSAFNRFAEELDRLQGEDGLDGNRRLPPHSQIILISDFLRPAGELTAMIDTYVDQGVTGTLLQINDPSEEDFPFTGRTRFQAASGKDHLTFGKAENVRSDYRTLFFAHRDLLAHHATRAGWTFTAHRTDHPLEAALLTTYLGLSSGPDMSARSQTG